MWWTRFRNWIRARTSRVTARNQSIAAGRDVNLAVVLNGLTASSAFRGKIQQFHDEYLVSETGSVPFGGRDKELSRLDHWLNDDRAASRLLLTAAAGRGKSALLVRWIASLHDRGLVGGSEAPWHVVFVPISIRMGTNLPSIFYQILAVGLADILGETCAAPVVNPEAHYADQASDLLRRLASNGTRVVVVIDGLDEALGDHFQVDIPRKPSAGLKMVVAARLQANDVDARNWRERLGWDQAVQVETMDLPALDRAHVADVLVKMGAPLDALAAQSSIVERLQELSEGEPLLLRYYVEDLSGRGDEVQRLRLEDLDEMRPGFAAYFRRWFEDQQRAWRDEGVTIDEGVMDVTLTVLACAFGPLERDDLAQLVQDVHGAALTFSTNRLLRPLRRFVMGNGSAASGYVLNHSKIGQYLREEHLSPQLVRRSHETFAAWGRATLERLDAEQSSTDRVPAYLLQFHHQHLHELGFDRERFLELVSDGWRRAWFQWEGGYQGFSRDVEVALRQIGALAEYPEPQRSQALNQKLRCVLCLSSISSLGTNVPADLLLLAVNSKALTVREALHIADLKNEPYPENRVQARIALAPQLSGLERVALLGDVRKLSNTENRAHSLVQLSGHLFGEERTAALFEARAIAVDGTLHPQTRLRLLLALASYFSEVDREPLISKAMETADEVNDGALFCEMARYLPNDQAPSVRARGVDAVRSVKEPQRRALFLAEVGFQLPDGDPARLPVFVEASELAETVIRQRRGRAWDEEFRLELAIKAKSLALAGLASVDKPNQYDLCEAAVGMARSATSEHSRVNALTALIPRLPASWRPEVLEDAIRRAKGLPSGNNRTHALTKLLPMLPADRQRDIALEALQAAFLIEDEFGRFRTFIRIAERTKGGVRAHAITRASAILRNGISYVIHRADALHTLAPYLCSKIRGDVLEEAYRNALEATNSTFRISTIIGLIPDLPEHLQPIATRYAFDGVEDTAFPTHNLIHLARVGRKHLGVAVLRRALKSARQEERGSRADCLMDLVDCFDGARREKMLKEVDREIESLPTSDQKVRKFVKLLSLLPEQERDPIFNRLTEALEAIPELSKKAAALTDAVVTLPQEWRQRIWAQAYALAITVGSSQEIAARLARLAPHLPSQESEEAVALSFESAQSLDRDQDRLGALSAVAPLLPPEQRIVALDLMLDSCSRLPRSSMDSVLRNLPALVAEDIHPEVIPGAIDALDEMAKWFP